jgi:hypothetical protein
MTIIKLKNHRWAPHSKYGYASGRLATICFDSEKECDEWIKENNNSYEGCTQYVSLPYILPTDLLNAEIESVKEEN